MLEKHTTRGRRDLRAGRASVRLIAGVALVAMLVVAAILAAGALVRSASGSDTVDTRLTRVERGPMRVTVRERGALWATQPVEIVNEVEGGAFVLELVDEGTVITQEDVDNKMVICRLDTSNLEERRADGQIRLYRAEASYTQAQENRSIQVKQNESDVSLAELNLRFARLELDRYLGAALSAQVDGSFNFAALADHETLGGRALQEVRTREQSVLLAEADLANKQDTLDWTRKLYDKGFVEKARLTSDELAHQRAVVRRDAAVEELRLFKVYTLPKEAEQRWSDYVEYQRDLDRVKARASSRLTQADADLRSRKANLELEQERQAKVSRMLEKSIIYATVPGRIVYGSVADATSMRGNNIEEGAWVDENRTIMRIPNLNSLAARVNIPEGVKDLVAVGQPAVITLDAVPGRGFWGSVKNVSPMASAENAWLNPDAKVYETDVALREAPDVYIPGMSAVVTIIVAELADAVQVPVQAVHKHEDMPYCWVSTPDGPQVRVVETGLSGEERVQILEGLRAGEAVYLASPARADEDELSALAKERREALARKAEEEGGGPAVSGDAEEEEEEAPAAQESPYIKNNQIDWATLGPELQKLGQMEPEAAMKRLKEIMDQLPEPHRAQVQRMIDQYQQGAGGEGEQPGGQSPGGQGRRGEGRGGTGRGGNWGS